MSDPLLKVNKLHTFFTTNDGAVHAVRGVSFHVYEGEIVGIVGESGSGKTALAKSILQLHDPRFSSTPTGEVNFAGADLLSLNTQSMNLIRGNDISMIFQDPMASLNPTMKIGEQLIEGYLAHNKLVHRGAAIQKALRLLEQVGIELPGDRFEMYPHQLSGGMRQRVMIAMAMMCSPKLLIADEPTTALDVTIQAQILRLIESLKTTVLLITHDIGVVASICTRVIVMYGGTIVEDASRDEILYSPKHPYTKRLLESIPMLNQNERLLPIEGTPPLLTKHEKGCPFAPRCQEKIDICNEIPPQLTLNETGRRVACHLQQSKLLEIHRK